MNVDDPERAAAEIVSALELAGFAAEPGIEGDRWRVDVRSEARAFSVYCFSRSEPKLDVVLYDEHDPRIADGVTGDLDEVVRSARAWFEHGDAERVGEAAPFIGATPRRMRRLAKQLPPSVRWEIEEPPIHALWVYDDDDDRCVQIFREPDRFWCGFWRGWAALGSIFLLTEDDVLAVGKAWTCDRLTTSDLAARFPAMDLDSHAAIAERDPTRRNWLEVLDLVADDTSTHAPLRPLVEALAESPVASRFHPYLGLDGLHFSSGSHCPWVGESEPVSGDLADLPDAVSRIEAALAARSIQPFIGTHAHHLHRLLVARSVAARVVRQYASYEVLVERGDRSCRVYDRSVTFVTAAARTTEHYDSYDEAADAIVRFVESST